MGDYLVILEHGDTPRSRRLRRNRLRVAVVIAALEGILVLAGVIPWWAVFAAAAVAIAVEVAVREVTWPALRQVTWIAAVSQLTVVLVPIAAAILTLLAVLVLVVIALVAVAALLYRRR